MRRGLQRPGLLIAVLGGGVLVYCVVASQASGGDPVVALEAVSAVALAAWAVVGGHNVWQARRMAGELNARCQMRSLAGVECRIVQGGGRYAFVLGAFRPTIYVGDLLVATLESDELEAVLLHEDHHRRTRAPLRTAALEAWLALAGRWAPIRAILVDRLTDLEEQADAAALRRGVSVASLASALVKTDPSLRPAAAAFASAADRRLQSLLLMAAGQTETCASRLPYEWLPVAAVAVVAVACHLAGLTPFSLRG
jgi:hypothetical protein